MNKEKLTFAMKKPIEGGKAGCGVCGYNHSTMPLSSVLAVGFGVCQVSKDGKIIYDEHHVEEYPTLQKFEDMAAQDPNHDYRLTMVLPLRETEHQRQGKGEWVLISQGQGFA